MLILNYLLFWLFMTFAYGEVFDLISCPNKVQCLEFIDEALLHNIKLNRQIETDPCNNFWLYACGNWSKQGYVGIVDNFGAVNKHYKQQMLKIFQFTDDDVLKKEDTDVLLQQMTKYYKACLNTRTYYLQMERYIDEWKSLSALDFEFASIDFIDLPKFNYFKTVADLRKFGLNNALFHETIGMAYNDSARYVVQLRMPDIENKFRSKYDIVNYFKEFGFFDSVRDAHVELAAKIYNFEVGIKALQARCCGNDQQKEYHTLATLKTRLPQLNWQEYFDLLLNTKAPAKLPIEIQNLAYFEQLEILVAATDHNIQYLYLLVNFLKYLLDISPQINNVNCIEHMNVHLPLGMNYLYKSLIYENYAKDDQLLQAIFENLKIQFSKQIQTNKMNLTKHELEYVQQKLMSMTLRLGNLPLNNTIIFYNQYYQTANFTTNNFYRNFLNILKFRTEQQHNGVLKNDGHLNERSFYIHDDIDDLRMAPYYVHQRNMIIMPMVFMQLPFFHHKLNALYHYSLTGWILAHELNHAFDMTGILLNANGAESTLGYMLGRKQEYRAAIDCLEHSLQRTTSINERLADVNGFQLVYDTYFKLVEDNSQDTVNCTTWTSQQLFYVSFAQFFCGKLPRAIDHDRDDVRVLETIANSKSFNDAFGCQQHLKQSIEYCEMWKV